MVEHPLQKAGGAGRFQVCLPCQAQEQLRTKLGQAVGPKQGRGRTEQASPTCIYLDRGRPCVFYLLPVGRSNRGVGATSPTPPNRVHCSAVIARSPAVTIRPSALYRNRLASITSRTGLRSELSSQPSADREKGAFGRGHTEPP